MSGEERGAAQHAWREENEPSVLYFVTSLRLQAGTRGAESCRGEYFERKIYIV